MKNIIVLSDTHGNKKAIDSIAKQLIEVDCVFHLGDVRQDAEYIKRQYNKNVVSVLGNCDFGASEEIVEIEKVKFMLCHGHMYSVKMGLNSLISAAKEKGVDACFFGHTHEALKEEVDGLTLINPGAMSSSYAPMSYCFVTVVNDKFFSKIVSIK
ncbi:MAG: metallophosphoesterase [Clostridia bacterium]